jgi:hypothetical protein
MLSTKATLKGRFLAIPRPERFTSIRVRPWSRWDETEVFHLQANQYIDLLDSDGDGQHAVRIGASTGGVDITGSFQWREATEGRPGEVVLAVRDHRANQTDVVMFGAVLPVAYVVAAPLAIWYGGMFFDFAAAIGGVVVTSAYQYASQLRQRYATPRWLANHLHTMSVHGVDNPSLPVRDPRILFLQDIGGEGMVEATGLPPMIDTVEAPTELGHRTATPVPLPATGPTSGAADLAKI